MKIAIISDAHLDFSGATANLMLRDLPDADLMVIAGDLVEAKAIDAALPFLRACNEKYEKTIWIPGNHEYYGMDIQDVDARIALYLDQNGLQGVFYTSLGVAMHQGFKIVCSTLWTDFDRNNPTSKFAWYQHMNDAAMIGDNRELGCRVVADTIYNLHKQAIELIKKHKDDDNVIVASHHAPSRESSPKYYRHLPSTAYYCSDLSNLILDFKHLPLWIHGHMHKPADYMIGDTRVISNPCGYHGYEPQTKDFKFVVIEV